MKLDKFTICNPIDSGCYADPEARFYEGKFWIYVTHSLPYEQQLNHTVFSSSDLTHWEKHENIIDMSTFPWVKKAVWAPSVVEKDGKYYYIFASNDIQSDDEIGGLEIAVADNPAGPFKALLDRPLVGKFENGAQPIDAHFFKDERGGIILYYGGWKHCNMCLMNEDMTGFRKFYNGSIYKELHLPYYVEGPCMFKRGNKYHIMWSSGSWRKNTYRVQASTGPTPFGPFSGRQIILSTGECDFANGPGHNGYLYVEELDLFMIVYHRHITDSSDPKYKDPNARYLCIDLMEFGDDGRIKPITMTKGWTYDNGKITVH